MSVLYLRIVIVFLFAYSTSGKNLTLNESAVTDKQQLTNANTNPVVDLVSDKKNSKEGNETDLRSKCECGVFNSQQPTEKDKALLTQSPLEVKCDETGEENCAKLCSALAQASKEKGPEILCSALGHFQNLKASIHSRICGAKQWTYTGLTSPHDICCHEHQVTACADKN